MNVTLLITKMGQGFVGWEKPNPIRGETVVKMVFVRDEEWKWKKIIIIGDWQRV